MVFHRPFKEFGQHLVKDAILFFKGNVDKKEQDPKLLVSEIVPLADIHKKFARSIRVKLPAVNLEENLLKNLQETLSQHPGNIPVYLEFVDQNNVSSEMLVDRTLFVRPNETLVLSLRKLAGEEAVSLKI